MMLWNARSGIPLLERKGGSPANIDPKKKFIDYFSIIRPLRFAETAKKSAS